MVWPNAYEQESDLIQNEWKWVLRNQVLTSLDYSKCESDEILSSDSNMIGPSSRLFSIVAKGCAESVLLHKSSNKSSRILLHKPLSAPSLGRF